MLILEIMYIKIKYIDSEGFIQCFTPDEYPAFNNVNTTEYFGITKQDFKDLINKAIFSVAIDDSRPILMILAQFLKVACLK